MVQTEVFSKVLVAGCGDIGRRVAAQWLSRGAQVHGLVRSDDSLAALREAGIAPLQGDLDCPVSLPRLPACELLYYFAPPPRQGGDDPRVVALQHALEGGTGLPRRVIYLSTTGVYGDHQGNWVDEQTPPRPVAERAQRRLAAEQQWLDWGRTHGVDVMVMRVGGIYGPGRLPRKRLERGEPILRIAESGYSNRIHVDDLVSVAMAIAEHGVPGHAYNAVDDAPGTMSEYFIAVADHLQLPRPPQITLAEAHTTLSPAMLSYLTESRRISNRRLHDELGLQLKYPTLAHGLSPQGCDTV